MAEERQHAALAYPERVSGIPLGYDGTLVWSRQLVDLFYCAKQKGLLGLNDLAKAAEGRPDGGRRGGAAKRER